MLLCSVGKEGAPMAPGCVGWVGRCWVYRELTGLCIASSACGDYLGEEQGCHDSVCCHGRGGTGWSCSTVTRMEVAMLALCSSSGASYCMEAAAAPLDGTMLLGCRSNGSSGLPVSIGCFISSGPWHRGACIVASLHRLGLYANCALCNLHLHG